MIIVIKFSYSEKNADSKINVLIQGWINIPHSYAIVNCFQVVHLLSNFPSRFQFYFDEQPYYFQKWYQNKALLYPVRYNNIIEDIPSWNGETINLIYRISYPHKITAENQLVDVPTIVFYSSLGALHPEDFNITVEDNQLSPKVIKTYISMASNLYFVTPTPKSSQGIVPYISKIDFITRHRVLPHGVDLTIFKCESIETKHNLRSILIQKYNLNENDIILLNVGGLSNNKGIDVILATLNKLVKNPLYKNIKVFLKGIDALYEGIGAISTYLEDLYSYGLLTPLEAKYLLKHHVKYISKSLSFEELNILYNSVDAYISPYFYEGFNIPILEALATGCPVFVSGGINSATTWYVNDIIQKTKMVIQQSENFSNYIESNISDVLGIFQLPSFQATLGLEENKPFRNRVALTDATDVLYKTIQTHWPTVIKFRKSDCEEIIKRQVNYQKVLIDVLDRYYSWNSVANHLMEYFEYVMA